MEWWQESSIPGLPEYSVVATPAMVPSFKILANSSTGQHDIHSTPTQHYGIVILLSIVPLHHLNPIQSFSTQEIQVMSPPYTNKSPPSTDLAVN